MTKAAETTQNKSMKRAFTINRKISQQNHLWLKIEIRSTSDKNMTNTTMTTRRFSYDKKKPMKIDASMKYNSKVMNCAN